jgi:hypothetical protein
MELKKAYTEVLQVCEKHSEISKSDYYFNDLANMANLARGHIMLINWHVEYGIKLEHKNEYLVNKYFKHDEHCAFSYYVDEQNYIAWSDDDRQPSSEWLFVISFPTGAFIFGGDYEYNQEAFKQFFTELKSFDPDYSDTANKTLYWKLDNAQEIFYEFNGILKKYTELVRANYNAIQVAKLKKEIEKLESK